MAFLPLPCLHKIELDDIESEQIFNFGAKWDMSKKVLSIDIQEDRACAALISSGLRGVQLVDSLCLMLAHGRDKEKLSPDLKILLLEIMGKMGREYDRCIVSIPANCFFFRTIQFPFKSRKNIRQILSFEIETLLPCSMEEISVDFNLLSRHSKGVSDDNKASVASVLNTHFELYESVFEACEIDPDVVTVGSGYSSALACAAERGRSGVSFFMHMESDAGALYALASGEIFLVRTFPLNPDDAMGSVKKNIHHTFLAYKDLFQTNSDLTEILVSGPGSLGEAFCSGLEKEMDVPVSAYNVLKDSRIKTVSGSFADHDMEFVQNAVAMCLNEARGLELFNFTKKVSGLDLFFNENRSGIIAAVILSLVLLLLLSIGPVMDIKKMETGVSRLDEKIIGIFQSSFPEIQTIVDPLQQMRTQVAALKKKEKVALSDEYSLSVDLLQETSRALPSALDIDFTRFVRTQTNLIISGSTDRFNTVDEMKSRLDKVKIFKSVEINSASMDKTLNRVKFNLKILL
jgi:general secretion pathway protein L